MQLYSKDEGMDIPCMAKNTTGQEFQFGFGKDLGQPPFCLVRVCLAPWSELDVQTAGAGVLYFRLVPVPVMWDRFHWEANRWYHHSPGSTAARTTRVKGFSVA